MGEGEREREDGEGIYNLEGWVGLVEVREAMADSVSVEEMGGTEGAAGVGAGMEGAGLEEELKGDSVV